MRKMDTASFARGRMSAVAVKSFVAHGQHDYPPWTCIMNNFLIIHLPRISSGMDGGARTFCQYFAQQSTLSSVQRVIFHVSNMGAEACLLVDLRRGPRSLSRRKTTSVPARRDDVGEQFYVLLPEELCISIYSIVALQHVKHGQICVRVQKQERCGAQ